MKKGYLFCMTHALPSACLMDETGQVVKSHGGENADDAKAWFYHFKKDDGYDVEEIDQSLVHKVFYEGASPEILREKHPEFADILINNAKNNENG